MTTEAQVEKMVKLAESIKSDVEKAKGGQLALIEELAKQFDVHSPKEAKEKQAEFEKELESLQQRYDELYAELQDKFGDRLK